VGGISSVDPPGQEVVALTARLLITSGNAFIWIDQHIKPFGCKSKLYFDG
jgi:hypothetical protein